MGATFFLGVDQSLNGTGLCLLDESGAVVRLETVDPGKRRGMERLAYIKARLLSLLEANVVFVTFEGYSYTSVGRVFELGEVGGVLRLSVHEKQVSYIDVAPASLKLFATGNGGATKPMMVSAAKALGVPAADDNQADAFFLAMVARYLYTGVTPSTRAQMDVVYHLKNPTPKQAVRRARKLLKNSV